MGAGDQTEMEGIMKAGNDINKNIDGSVDSPSHYVAGEYECIDVMLATQGMQAVMDFCLCNAFKYLFRCRKKNGVEDIKKAAWYLDEYIDLYEQREASPDKEDEPKSDRELELMKTPAPSADKIKDWSRQAWEAYMSEDKTGPRQDWRSALYDSDWM